MDRLTSRLRGCLKLGLIVVACGLLVVGVHHWRINSARSRALAILARPGSAGNTGSYRTQHDSASAKVAAVVHRLTGARMGGWNVRVRSCFAIESIEIWEATDADLEQLSVFTECRELRFLYGRFSDQGLRRLAGMKNLRRLSISCEQMTDEGLANLRGLDHLEELELHSTKVEGWGFQYLTCRDSLRVVWVDYSETFNDDGMLQLAIFPNLEELAVDEWAVKGPGLQVIEKLPKLRTFHGLGDNVDARQVIDPQWHYLVDRLRPR